MPSRRGSAADFSDGGANRPILDGELVGLARTIVDDGERVLRHYAGPGLGAEKITGYRLSAIGYQETPIADSRCCPATIGSIRPSLYPTRSSAGAQLGKQLAERGHSGGLLLGITPEGVEIAAHAAKAMGATFDVVVASFIKLGANLAPIGAMAESAPAEMDPDFLPGMNLLEKLQAAIDESRSQVKQDLVLYRTQRPVKPLQGRTAIIVDGQIVYPWKVLAAAKAVEGTGCPRGRDRVAGRHTAGRGAFAPASTSWFVPAW